MTGKRYYKHQVNTEDYRRARTLRRDSSQIEQKFWFALRQASAAKGLKFRRQQPIHPYIADFACMQAKLIVELDGMSHDARANYDRRRDMFLQMRGYKIFRISNHDVMENLAVAIESIIACAEALLKTSGPLTSKN